MAEQSPINNHVSQAKGGMFLDQAISDIPQGGLTYSLNAVTSSAYGDSIKYQNEPGNLLCCELPKGYKLCGRHQITEQDIIVVWLYNNITGDSEIGTISSCVYTKYINAECIGLDEDHPIHTAVHRITPKGIEVYWTNGKGRYFINLSTPPYQETPDPNECGFITSTEIDCNKLNVQPNFSIPNIEIDEIDIGGELTAGTYQFTVQYGNADSEPYTSFYSVTNPLPIGNPKVITSEFNYSVGKSIRIKLTNLDVTGYYDFINIAVIKSVNLITSVELIGTYRIEETTKTVVYSGQKKDNIRLTVDDIFEKYPIFEKADSLFTVQDVLGWYNLTTNERINYQEIWSKVHLQWQTYRIPKDDGYIKEITSAEKKGYFRDEVYPLEGCFLLANGYQTDRFHIPSRVHIPYDLELINGDDTIYNVSKCEADDESERNAVSRWKVYNTGSLIANEEQWNNSKKDNCYNGPYQYGEFAYWESEETYPCDNKLWGELAGKPIRHHKFPDSNVTHIHDRNGNIYPIGIKVDVQQLVALINHSSLTEDQKKQIVGFKILRGNRVNNKSVIARGLIHNVLKYTTNDDFSGDVDQSIQEQITALCKQANDTLNTGLVRLQGGAGSAEILTAMTEIQLGSESIIGSPAYISHFTTADNDLTTALSLVDSSIEPYISAGQSIIESLIDLEPTDTSTILSSVSNSNELYFPNYPYNDVTGDDPFLNYTKIDDSSKERYVFHSPDTHFYQPYLGQILKLETVESGLSEGHFVEVKNHAKYQFVSLLAYITASLAGLSVGFASGTYGLSNNVFNGTAAFTAYKVMLDIIYKVAPRRNFCYQYNSIGDYSTYFPVPNTGNKQRRLDIASYLVPGIQNVSDNFQVNNFQRESAVYLKTNKTFPFTHEVDNSIHSDDSKFLIENYNIFPRHISSYYATIKNNITTQYGQIYSYESLDTGFQKFIDLSTVNNLPGYIFGGDCFINRFAYKSKIPFFTDNRINFPDEADIFYNELSNVGESKYWFSTDSTQHNTVLGAIFGIKTNNFYWKRNRVFTTYGNIFLFAYGIPQFWCESEVNVDYRQAFNDKEGDFYPRVSTGIPDEWFQEINTSIKQDNTYFYNKTYSKQNKENLFTSIPEDYTDSDSRQYLTHTAIYSDPQKEITNYKHNNWLIYKPVSRYDFPKNYGKLIAIDGLSDRSVLVRYENRSQLYNTLLTVNTSSPKAAYLGNDTLFKSSPPIDFSDIETGYSGGYNKMLLRTEIGPVFCDTKRGSVFALQGTSLKNISNSLSSFFANNLKFYLKDGFPTYNIDNHFKDVGLTGVYDQLYKRIIITKRDYECIDSSVILSGNKFYKNDVEISLTNDTYFTDRSFTFSFGLDIQNYVSFHSYIPNYYIPDNIGMYMGWNDNHSDIWTMSQDNTLFNNFRGDICPYILEFPYSYKFQDEILQNIKDYTRVLKYNPDGSYVQTNDIFFNQAILYNQQQCSGILELTSKPKNSLKDYMKYPKYNTDSKTITFTKSDSFYNYNTFWSLLKDNSKPIWKTSNIPSMFKELNQENMNYSKMSFNKAPLRSKELLIRNILNDRSDHKLISEFILHQTVNSYK